MNRKVVLLTSVALALLCVVLMQMYKTTVARELGVGGERVRILAARTTIPQWSVVESSQVAVMEFPREWLPPTYLPEALLDTIVGQTVGETVPEGEPLLNLHLADANGGHRLSQVVESGQRALPLEIDKVTAFGGLLKPGDYVDILMTIQNPRDRTVETRTLLQGVAILAVGGSLGSEREAGARGGGTRRINNVTVLVTAEEAELLVLAEDQGELSLTMRNFGDVGSEKDLPGRELADLLQEERIIEMQKGRDHRNCIQINSGGRGSSTKCAD
jgi:pilus assembly protein CpaB